MGDRKNSTSDQFLSINEMEDRNNKTRGEKNESCSPKDEGAPPDDNIGGGTTTTRQKRLIAVCHNDTLHLGGDEQRNINKMNTPAASTPMGMNMIPMDLSSSNKTSTNPSPVDATPDNNDGVDDRKWENHGAKTLQEQTTSHSLGESSATSSYMNNAPSYGGDNNSFRVEQNPGAYHGNDRSNATTQGSMIMNAASPPQYNERFHTSPPVTHHHGNQYYNLSSTHSNINQQNHSYNRTPNNSHHHPSYRVENNFQYRDQQDNEFHPMSNQQQMMMQQSNNYRNNYRSPMHRNDNRRGNHMINNQPTYQRNHSWGGPPDHNNNFRNNSQGGSYYYHGSNPTRNNNSHHGGGRHTTGGHDGHYNRNSNYDNNSGNSWGGNNNNHTSATFDHTNYNGGSSSYYNMSSPPNRASSAFDGHKKGHQIIRSIPMTDVTPTDEVDEKYPIRLVGHNMLSLKNRKEHEEAARMFRLFRIQEGGGEPGEDVEILYECQRSYPMHYFILLLPPRRQAQHQQMMNNGGGHQKNKANFTTHAFIAVEDGTPLWTAQHLLDEHRLSWNLEKARRGSIDNLLRGLKSFLVRDVQTALAIVDWIVQCWWRDGRWLRDLEDFVGIKATAAPDTSSVYTPADVRHLEDVAAHAGPRDWTFAKAQLDVARLFCRPDMAASLDDLISTTSGPPQPMNNANSSFDDTMKNNSTFKHELVLHSRGGLVVNCGAERSMKQGESNYVLRSRMKWKFHSIEKMDSVFKITLSWWRGSCTIVERSRRGFPPLFEEQSQMMDQQSSYEQNGEQGSPQDQNYGTGASFSGQMNYSITDQEIREYSSNQLQLFLQEPIPMWCSHLAQPATTVFIRRNYDYMHLMAMHPYMSMRMFQKKVDVCFGRRQNVQFDRTNVEADLEHAARYVQKSVHDFLRTSSSTYEITYVDPQGQTRKAYAADIGTGEASDVINWLRDSEGYLMELTKFKSVLFRPEMVFCENIGKPRTYDQSWTMSLRAGLKPLMQVGFPLPLFWDESAKKLHCPWTPRNTFVTYENVMVQAMNHSRHQWKREKFYSLLHEFIPAMADEVDGHEMWASKFEQQIVTGGGESK